MRTHYSPLERLEFLSAVRAPLNDSSPATHPSTAQIARLLDADVNISPSIPQAQSRLERYGRNRIARGK